MRFLMSFLLIWGCYSTNSGMVDGMPLLGEERSESDPMALSFDQLFPMSPGRQVIDMCMNVYEDLPLLQEMSAVVGCERLVADAMLGKATRLDYSLQRVLKQNRVAGFSGIHQDDSFYLLEMVGHIERACIDMGIMHAKNGAEGIDPEQMDVKHMLHTIKVRLKQIAHMPEEL